MEAYDPKREYALEELQKRNLIEHPWDAVDLFEKEIARYVGSEFAIAVDNCTDAIFLCLKYLEAQCDKRHFTIEIPKKTYASVPMAIHNAGFRYRFKELEWTGAYQLHPYPIYDSALRLTKDMYVPNTFQCLSFHRKKILKLTKGGMILTDDAKAASWLKEMRSKGRHPHNKRLYKNETFNVIGWNMYLPPEYAAQGYLIFKELPEHNPDAGGSQTYTDLSSQEIFKRFEVQQ